MSHISRSAFEEAARDGEAWFEAGSQRIGQRPGSGPAVRAAEPVTLEQAMERHSLLLEQALSLKPNPRSMIKVEPRVNWPKLGDDGPGGKEVQEF